MPENIASVRVIEKAGLHYVETVSLWEKRFSKYLTAPPLLNS
jgi:cyclopropane fatty-acyl-phospholipid synthase-like methyltransferase